MTAQLLEEFKAESIEIIESLLEDGSDPDATYEIEHHLGSTDFKKLEAAAVELFKKGYEVTDAEEAELDDGAKIFCFDVVVECDLELEGIMKDVESILTIAEKMGIEYDGWGTYFEGGEEDED